MTDTADVRELVLDTVLDAPRDKVWRCWTEAELMKRWWSPAPWGSTPLVEIDPRAGGTFRTVMRAQEGGMEMDNSGVILEVAPGERFVWTDAFTRAWVPSGKAFMVVTVTLEDAEGGRTRYVARVRHWSDEDAESHRQMGFHEGWGLVATQLEATARSL